MTGKKFHRNPSISSQVTSLWVTVLLVVTSTMDAKQFRVLIYHCFLMKKNTVQAKKWLDKCYSDSAPSKVTVERWFAEFKCGRTSTEDAERSGRPNEVVTPENIKKAHKIILENRKVKLQEIADIMKMSKGSVFTILHEHLSMRKLFSKWVPRSLSQVTENDGEIVRIRLRTAAAPTIFSRSGPQRLLAVCTT